MCVCLPDQWCGGDRPAAFGVYLCCGVTFSGSELTPGVMHVCLCVWRLKVRTMLDFGKQTNKQTKTSKCFFGGCKRWLVIFCYGALSPSSDRLPAARWSERTLFKEG